MKLSLDAKPPPKCKHCRKSKYLHKATTLNCPVGMKTRIGYTSYHATQSYEPKNSSRSNGKDAVTNALNILMKLK